MGETRNIGRSLTILAVTLMVFTASISDTARASTPSAFFTLRQTKFRDLSAFTKWTAVMPRYRSQKSSIDRECAEKECPSAKWEKLLVELKDKPLNEKLDQVNRFFNAMAYVEDKDNWGVEDYWETPYELMARGGDCEDYAIAKYISLKRLGVSENDMRITIVRDDNLGGVMHAVLQVSAGKTRYLLDNQASSVTVASEIYHYQPIYAINAHNWWAYQ